MSKSDERELDSRPLLCHPCLGDRKRFTASIYCIDCEECQCSRCYKVHRRFSYMKGHDTIDLEPGYTMAHLSRLRSYNICADHNKKIEYICIDENKLCCRKCKRENHRNCMNVHHICEVATENPEVFEDLKSKADGLRNQIMTVSKFLNKTEEELDSESQLDDLGKELRDTKEKLMRRLEEFSSEMLKIGQDRIKRKKETNNNAATACEKIQSKLDEMFELMEFCQHTPVLQKFIFQHKLEMKFTYCQKRASLLYAQLRTPGKLVVSYGNKMESVVHFKSSFGSVYLKDESLNFSEIPDYRAVRVELFRSRTFQKRSHEDADMPPRITGIDFLDDDRLVITDQTIKTQRIYNEELVEVKRKTTYRQIDITRPSAENFVAIRLRFVHFYERKDEKIYHIKQVPMHMDNDTISINDAHSLFVCVSGVTRPAVNICDFGTEGDLNFQLPKEDNPSTKSLFFKTNVTEILVVSFRERNTIIIVDTKRKAAKCITNDKTICQPGYMCVGPSGTFFLCCWSDNIVQISAEGSILAVFNTGIPEPKVIAMSKDQRKIGAAGNGQIQVYNIIQE
ncbi:uncharacterized protein LOC123538646 [Mercenaria mercenaria]|uniref:uncharacterized protein LOC123538646 n=1 Tax=Mercenaria mercenaria TaxID=6596 RepID=UPI00234EB8B5|nr:uncharacterized protein LOC123538646 [Mercenaria mercenaria]